MTRSAGRPRFAAIAATGLPYIIHYPEVLKALSPHYGAVFLATHGLHGFLLLGSVVLCITGNGLKTAEAVRRMQIGEVLHVVSDDRVILIDMPAWCRSHGHALVHTEQQGREYHLYVQKSERRAKAPAAAE